MSIAPPQPRVRAMSAIRRPTSTSSTSSSTNRSRTSIGGVGSEQTTPRSSVSSHRPRSSHSMIERPASLGGRGTLEQSASGMARPSPLSSSRPLPPGRSTSGGAKKASPFPPIELERSISPGTNEALEGALRREVEEKEELMLRLAQRDEAISQLEARLVEMDNTMTQGEGQLAELYADQERWEAERDSLEKSIAKKTTIIEKLRIQLRELDKENRDYTRRLTEQAAQFESERQAFYDNTTHLKSRIQSLTDQQREWKEHRREEEVKEEAPPSATGEPAETRLMIPFPREDDRVEDREPEEPAEMSALRLELSTLSTSHGSLGQTVKMLQGQLADLQRVNLTLQEENEAFTTLLKEKTLSGQIDILRRGSRSPSPEPSEEDAQEESSSGLLSPMQSPPPRARTQSRALKPMRAASPAPSGKSGRSAKRIAAETLADLPVAGPGLDLAAELGRAVNRLEDDLVPPEEEAKEEEKKEEETVKIPHAEFEALKAEVKHLKDANKALTLYASKIIDRIITQDAFEHILAVDYTKPQEKEKPKPAPQPKSFFQRATSLSISGGAAPKITARPPLKVSTDAANAGTSSGLDSPSTPMDRRERRGLSMDWRRLSLFSKAPATPVEDVRTAGLKPLTLGKTISNEPMPSTPKDEPFPIVHGGRKLDNQEDEEDQVERERLHAHLKLMGVQPSAAPTSFAAAGSALASSDSIPNRSDSSLSRSGTSSPSWWNKRPESSELRAEHLELGDDEHEVREAETRIAQMEKKEKHLSAELAKGKGGGFTEPPPKGSRVRRRAGSGASGASTLFSAGRMSRGGSEGGIDEEQEL